MSIIAEVYASAPTESLIIPSLEIQAAGLAPIRICVGFEDQRLGVDGQFHLFEAGSLSISLPKKNSSGTQTLVFGVANVNATAQGHVQAAIDADQPVTIIYRVYLESDKSEPAERPYVMTLKGGSFEKGYVQLEASWYDFLNTSWPREFYDETNAPGIRYL